MRLGAARAPKRRITARRIFLGVLGLVFVWFGATQFSRLAAAADEPALVTLSIVGTSDLHGAALPRNGGPGGLPLLAGYVNNLRAARASDGGAVLLIDSGDTFQGDVESNLSEGALVVDAYNAMGYTAEAIGNHDFDFGVGRFAGGAAVAGRPARRAQGARRPGAVSLSRGEPDRRGDGPAGRVAQRSAIGARRGGRHQGRHRRRDDDRRAAVDPRRQRAGTADRAARRRRSPRTPRSFERPAPTSSSSPPMRAGAASDSISPRICRRARPSRRFFGWREACRTGWWMSSPPVTRTAGSRTGQRHRHHPAVLPRPVVRPRRRRRSIGGPGASRGCSPSRRSQIVPAEYEGKARRRDDPADRPGDGAGAPARSCAPGHTARRLARRADSPSRHLGSPLGNLFADGAPRRGAGRGRGGDQQRRRAACGRISPTGPVTFGRLYDVFPFDNRVARITLSGAELGRWVAGEIRQGRRGSLGISGVEVRTTLSGGRPARRSVPRADARFTTTTGWSP